MPEGIGAPELLIILVIIMLLFGVGRVSNLGRELGTAIKEFRKGLVAGDKDTAQPTEVTEEN